MSIEGIVLEHFSATDQETPPSYLHSCIRHDFFYSFLYDHIKQDADTTAENIKLII